MKNDAGKQEGRTTEEICFLAEYTKTLIEASVRLQTQRGSTIELVLLNAQRQLWRFSGSFPRRHDYKTDATTHDSGWRILGWRMADGSMPLGEYDAVDPELAQFDYLPVPNVPEVFSPSIPRDGGRIDRSDSEKVAPH